MLLIVFSAHSPAAMIDSRCGCCFYRLWHCDGQIYYAKSKSTSCSGWMVWRPIG